MKSSSLLIAVLIVVVMGYIFYYKGWFQSFTEGFATAQPEVYAVSFVDSLLNNAGNTPYVNMQTNKAAVAAAFGAQVATEAQVRAVYTAGARWNKACVISTNDLMYYTTETNNVPVLQTPSQTESSGTNNVTGWLSGVLLYGVKPSAPFISASSPEFVGTQIPTIFGLVNSAGEPVLKNYVFKIWGFKEQVAETVIQKYAGAGSDADTTASGNRMGYKFEMYAVSLKTEPYDDLNIGKHDFATALGASVATEAQVREAYAAGARWYKTGYIAEPSERIFYTAQADGTDGSKAGDLITVNKRDGIAFKAGILLYGFKPSVVEFGDETTTFKVWGFKEQVAETITQKYQIVSATDADTLNGVARLGYEPPTVVSPIGSSSSSARATTMPGAGGTTVVSPIGSSSSSARATTGGGTDIESIMASILSRLGSERCETTPRGRGARLTGAAPTQNNVSLPPTQPSLNLTALMQAVRNLGSSVQTTADSEVLARFIRHYGAQRRIPSDDTNSILIDYIAYPNFYENFYSILDDNNKRIFREYNFDIQAYLINIINQFNRDTMIALHYILDPNFIVEDVADTAADAAAAGDSAGASDVYTAFKPRIIQDISDAITRQLEEKCSAGGAGAGAGAGTGAARPADAGSGPVPPYVPPAGGSGSLPTIIPPTIPGSQAAPALTGNAAAAAAANARAAAGAGSSGTPACAPEACAAADACSPSLDQGSNWQYMILPSAGAAKCGDTKKAAPSLIWGE